MTVRLFSLPEFRTETIQYADAYDTVVSADESGFLEYWQPTEPYEPPKHIKGMWQLKSQTDLYEFKKVCLPLVLNCDAKRASSTYSVEIYPNITHILAILLSLRYTVFTRSTAAGILFPHRQIDTHIRRKPYCNPRNAASRNGCISRGRYGIWPSPSA